MAAAWFSRNRLDAAYDWLCHRRKNYPANADIWWLRQRWQSEKPLLVRELATGRLRFEPLRQITLKTGETIELWSARDALVLKMLAWSLADVLPASERCTHLRNHGGAKYAIRAVIRHLPDHPFVMRTDVKSYYASIDHHLLLDRLARYVKDRFVLNLVAQYLQRCVEHGGLYRQINQGISLGCPLSPIIAAFFLHTLDTQMEKSNVFYVRFMDDVLVMARTRWKLRHAVKRVNQAFADSRMDKHPDKTFIGKIDRGFEFLGYHISPTTVLPATRTVRQYAANISRLYEQGASQKRIEQYQRRWMGWCTGKLGDMVSPSFVKQYVELSYGPVQMSVPGTASSST